MARDIESILVELRDAIRVRYGREALALCVKLHDGSKISLPFPLAVGTATPSPNGTALPATADGTHEPFVPTPFQLAILEALEHRAMRTDALGAAVGDRGRLYKPGGLRELRDRGFVAHHERLGFYRPEKPPDELV